ncbi:hypothetical protein ACQP2U_33260 [Nocardia sp. CA-084685]|uniref:hypothetical protein n=1 Tax=Nocardia sp. CA-084685 TaxID=3239970 RepID=UPI003D983ECF
MPDPDKIDLSPSVQNYYEGPRGLAVSLRDHYLSTGEESPEEAPDLKPPELDIEGDKQFSGIENYEVKQEKLRMTGVKLVEAYGDVPDRIRRSAGYSKEVRVWTSKFIEDHNAAISEWPPDGVSHDEYCMNEITKTIDNLNAIMADAVKGQKKEADEIEKLAQQVEKLTQQSETLAQQVKKLKQQVGDEGDPRPGELDPKDLGVPKQPGMPFDPGIPYDPSPPMDPRLPLDSNQSLDPDLTEDPGASPYRSDVGLDPQEAVAGPAAPAATPIGSAMGSRDDQTTGINPWMIPALANSMQPGVRNEPDPDRLPRDDEAVAPSPIPAVTAAPVATPGSQPPAGAVPNHSQPIGPGAGPNVTSAQSALPTRTPAQDGSGDRYYSFPEGERQWVSAVVAQALDAAFGNASGTDAKAAYANTPAKWSDNKQIDPVDPYQLMTGDVATWEKDHSAIVVVFGSFESGTPEVVVNGQLRPFAAEMSDSAGDFGAFAGFRHPRGIEVTTPAPDSAAPASSPADASAATTASVAAVPAT